MSKKYVVSHLEQQIGPFDENELKAKWAKGELLPIDYVYDEDAADWILLSEKFLWVNPPKAEEPPAAPPPISDDTIKRRRPVELTPLAAPTPAPAPVIQMEPEVPVITMKTEAPVLKSEVPVENVRSAAKIAPPTGGSVEKAFERNAGHGARVKLTDGSGEIELNPMAPGQLEVVLQESSATLKLQQPLRIHVKPMAPANVLWTVPDQQVVGTDVWVELKALDEHGKQCIGYDETYTIQVRGPATLDIPAKFQDGIARVKLSHTKSEFWRLSLGYNGPLSVKLPEDRTLEWQPGQATRLILDGPQEYLAGNPLKVQVKAVDAYGNLAKTFQGTVILEVKAS